VLDISNQALRRSTSSGTQKAAVRFCIEKSRNPSGAGPTGKDRRGNLERIIESETGAVVRGLPITTLVIPNQSDGCLCEQKMLTRSAPGYLVGR